MAQAWLGSLPGGLWAQPPGKLVRRVVGRLQTINHYGWLAGGSTNHYFLLGSDSTNYYFLLASDLGSSLQIISWCSVGARAACKKKAVFPMKDHVPNATKTQKNNRFSLIFIDF